jgi:peptidoglycan/xylan/chitin deacetylase (PgdA/CDA1 family)
MGIGSHTHTHPILSKENHDTALAEIEQSKVILENIINQPVDYFAYPNGKFGLDFDSNHIDMVKKCGFLSALSTDKGVLANQEIDNFNIKRFTPWDETEFKFVLRLALNYC